MKYFLPLKQQLWLHSETDNLKAALRLIYIGFKSENTANSDSTIEFAYHLKAQSGEAKLFLVWNDGSYYRSEQFLDHL